jgi:hypothetical protein
MVAKMVKSRREQLDIDLEAQAADQALLDKVKARMADRDEKKISPKREERTAEENRYLGTIARILVAEDSSLKRRFVQQAVKTYGGIGDGRARRHLERIVGKIPVSHPDSAKPDPLMEAAAE